MKKIIILSLFGLWLCGPVAHANLSEKDANAIVDELRSKFRSKFCGYGTFNLTIRSGSGRYCEANLVGAVLAHTVCLKAGQMAEFADPTDKKLFSKTECGQKLAGKAYEISYLTKYDGKKVCDFIKTLGPLGGKIKLNACDNLKPASPVAATAKPTSPTLPPKQVFSSPPEDVPLPPPPPADKPPVAPPPPADEPPVATSDAQPLPADERPVVPPVAPPLPVYNKPVTTTPSVGSDKSLAELLAEKKDKLAKVNAGSGVKSEQKLVSGCPDYLEKSQMQANSDGISILGNRYDSASLLQENTATVSLLSKKGNFTAKLSEAKQTKCVYNVLLIDDGKEEKSSFSMNKLTEDDWE